MEAEQLSAAQHEAERRDIRQIIILWQRNDSRHGRAPGLPAVYQTFGRNYQAGVPGNTPPHRCRKSTADWRWVISTELLIIVLLTIAFVLIGAGALFAFNY